VVSRAEPSILHVDLDAFYASVEQLADPSLRGRPVIVGGLGRRGVVAASSYEARAFGVHSAMPTGQARRLCPHGVFLAPRFDEYERVSRQVHEVFRSFTPLIEPIALDEAFLDVIGARRLFGAGPEIGEQVRERIRTETGLTASVGAATTKLLAKLASDLAKPDGMLVVEPGGELEFLHPLPVERLWGVGPKTLARLRGFGVTTIGDLAAVPADTLVRALGNAAGQHLHDLAWNRDERAVEPDRELKSIGQEETFSHDLVDRDALHREALRLGERVGTRLREHGLAGRTITLKVRFADFRTITRSSTLPEATELSSDIVRVATGLLASINPGHGIRLLGVSVRNLTDATAVQRALPFGGDEASDARGEVERAVDDLRRRFGDDVVGSAALLDREGTRRSGSPWGPNE
jgi:DNA polymerase-4